MNRGIASARYLTALTFEMVHDLMKYLRTKINLLGFRCFDKRKPVPSGATSYETFEVLQTKFEKNLQPDERHW